MKPVDGVVGGAHVIHQEDDVEALQAGVQHVVQRLLVGAEICLNSHCSHVELVSCRDKERGGGKGVKYFHMIKMKRRKKNKT